jgi:hypothetical protein
MHTRYASDEGYCTLFAFQLKENIGEDAEMIRYAPRCAIKAQCFTRLAGIDFKRSREKFNLGDGEMAPVNL